MRALPLPKDRRFIFLVVLVVAALYVRWRLGHGWMPFDDGAMAQSADRLNQGQLPHRDFDEVYTGGLTWANAVAFRLFGTNLWSLRLVLFAVFLGWVPSVEYIASRFVRPLAAAGMTLLAVVWSVPNYPAAMPSWYNLFFATFGVAALLRFLETDRRRWLFAAGVAGGLSFLVKVVGLYYFAGVLLFLVFVAHDRARLMASEAGRPKRVYAAFVSVALVLFVLSVFSLVRRQFHPSEVVQFLAPATLIALLLAGSEWREPVDDARGFAVLARLTIPVVVGLVLPVVVFLIPYARGDALGAFVTGVFLLPARRFEFAYTPAPSLVTIVALIPLIALALLLYRSPRLGRGSVVAVAATLLVLLIGAMYFDAVYRGVWYALRWTTPILTLAGVAVLWRRRADDAARPMLREQTMLLLCVSGLCTLVQFPYAAPNYFCYVAPLVGLTALALYQFFPATAAAVPGALVGFLIAFAVLLVNGRPLQTIGFRYAPPFPMAPLALDRGGIDVPQPHAEAYDGMIPLLEAHAHGGYTWASPDAPEIYFLSGLKNPTRTLYDFFAETPDEERQTLRMLDSLKISAIVLNSRPAFSRDISQRMYQQLAAKYPHGKAFGPFLLLWRE